LGKKSYWPLLSFDRKAQKWKILSTLDQSKKERKNWSGIVQNKINIK